MKKLSNLALKNLKCHKWLNTKIIIALVSLITVLSLFLVFTFSLIQTKNNKIKLNVSANYIYTNTAIEDNLPSGTEYLTLTYCGGEYFQDIKLSLNGNEYSCTKSSVTGTGDNIMEAYSGDQLFTKNDYTELKLVYNYDDFIIGSIPKNGDEIVISARMLSFYNLTADDVLGQKLTFLKWNQSTNNYSNVYAQATISGVIREEYNQLRGHSGVSGFMPSIYVAKDSDWYNAHSTDNYYIYSFADWLTYEQVDSLVSTRSQYCGYGVIGEIEFIEQIFNVVINLFAIVGISLGVGMLLMIYLLMDKYTKYSAKSGGILLTNGISKVQWNICVLIQMLVICLISCCFSFVLTTAIYCLLGVGLNNLFVYGYAFNLITINGNYFLTLFGVEIAMLIIVSLSLFLINWLTTKDKSIKQLLNTNVS